MAVIKKTVKTAADAASKALDAGAAVAAGAMSKAYGKAEESLYVNLTPEEHRRALIETCVMTDGIFENRITDPPEKAGEDFKNYMFYNQLYFLAANQLMRPDETGSMLPGIVKGISIIAGAAITSKNFRRNLKEHAEDAILKYVEPFKDKFPKLWQEISAKVESHPGTICPESQAIRLLRYQKQADDMLKSGQPSDYVNELLLKKTMLVKKESDTMNLDWDEITGMRDQLSSDLSAIEARRHEMHPGEDWKERSMEDMESLQRGLSELTGNCSEWERTMRFEAPADVKSAAKKLRFYQECLQASVEELHSIQDGTLDKHSPDYADMDGLDEAGCFQYFQDQVKALKECTDAAGLSWSEIATEYDNINRREYDELNTRLHEMEAYVEPECRDYFGKDGHVNKSLGRPNTRYYNEASNFARMGKVQKYNLPDDYVEVTEALREHNVLMHYELPVDAKSAGRCLKKYQQDAYENVRDVKTRDNFRHKPMDSATAYDLTNSLTRKVKHMSDAIGFDWKHTIKEYRKDLFTTVGKSPEKRSMFSELVNMSIIDTIPKTAMTRSFVNGEVVETIKPLPLKEQIERWNGILYGMDGEQHNDSLLKLRDPYTREGAVKNLCGLFTEKAKLEKAEAVLLKKQGKGNLKGDSLKKFNTIAVKKSRNAARTESFVQALKSDHYSQSTIDSIFEEAEKNCMLPVLETEVKQPQDDTGHDLQPSF